MAYSGKFSPKNTNKYLGDPTNIWYRSLWERRVMTHLDINSNVIEWSNEEIIIPYLSPIDNRWHRYFPDFFARVPVGKALNPIPIDSNRAVNGLSSQRSLVDVAQNLQAKGPLATYTEQKITTLEKIDRERYQEELEKGSSLKSTLEKDLKIDPLLKVVPPRTFVPPRCGVILSKFNKVLSIFKKH